MKRGATDIAGALAAMRDLPVGLYGGDFLHTWKQSDAELRAILHAADVLQALHRDGRSLRLFESGLAISIFRDQSTRTRFSFSGAANLLGLGVQELDEKKSQIAHGETVRETANMISFLTEVIGIRDDMYLGAGHTYMAEVAQAVQQGYDEGVLAQRPAVINLQCDLDHPTQSMADLLHLKQTFGSLENLRDKRIAMTWAYSPSYGKPLSVPQGIITLMARFGMDVVLAHPTGYGLVPDTLDTARTFAGESGGSFTVTDSMDDAFANADIVYPKSWAPFQVMQQRTDLLSAGDHAGLEELERKCLAQNANHKDWECTKERMARTKNGDALYMHCLPADISGVSCDAGEVSKDVFEKARLATYFEAACKPFVIAAMIMLTRFEDAPAKLAALAESGQSRRG